MSESPTQNKNKNKKPLIDEKSIPEHIIDGTIVIDSVEAFSSILKQFPGHPALLKKNAHMHLMQEIQHHAAKANGAATPQNNYSRKQQPAVVAKKKQMHNKTT